MRKAKNQRRCVSPADFSALPNQKGMSARYRIRRKRNRCPAGELAEMPKNRARLRKILSRNEGGKISSSVLLIIR